VPPLLLGPHGALGSRARHAEIPVQVVQAHLQRVDENAAGAIAIQEALADLRWNDDREQERSRERRDLRSKRDYVFTLASPVSRLLIQPTSPAAGHDCQRFFEHSNSRLFRERRGGGETLVVQGTPSDDPVLDTLEPYERDGAPS